MPKALDINPHKVTTHPCCLLRHLSTLATLRHPPHLHRHLLKQHLFWLPKEDVTMVFSEKEVTSLYRVHRTVLEMLRDRNYLVPDSEVNMSIQEFKAKFGENMRRGDLDMMKTNKDDPSDKINVFFSDSTKLGVKAVTTFRDRMLNDDVHRGILVLQNQVSSQGRRELMNFYSKVRIEIFMEDELLVNITKHELVPKHQVLTDAEKKELLKTYTCQQTQLPKMLITDPVAKYYGLERGQVVRIIRSSETAGVYITYRIVV